MAVPSIADTLSQGMSADLVIMLWLLALGLVISTIGFYRVVYFVSIGYAFSIVTMAIAITVGLRQNLSWATVLQNLLLIVWGLRLGSYLVRRESRSAYRQDREEAYERRSKMSLLRKVAIWIGVAALYVLMYSPALFGLATLRRASTWWTWLTQIVGLAIMGGGLALEAIADKQKSDFKAQNPTKFCNVGLYRWVRCPNYLGEIAVWLGSWIAALSAYTSLLRWLASLIGLVCLILIMMGSTKRLEQAQGERYGRLPEYQEYIRRVPVLFPFVPVYTLENVPVILE